MVNIGRSMLRPYELGLLLRNRSPYREGKGIKTAAGRDRSETGPDDQG